MDLLRCYIMVSEQFILIEPEVRPDYASKHNSVYAMLSYALDIVCMMEYRT